MITFGSFNVNELDRFTDALDKAYDIANDLEVHGYRDVAVTTDNETIVVAFKLRKEEE